MARLFVILCMVCLAGAIAVVLMPDPWTKADQKAEQDAELFAGLISQPDRIGWRITEDVSLLRVMLWDQDGTRQYPTREGLTPVPYEFSQDQTRLLTAKQVAVETAAWSPFETTGRELVNCRSMPAICLIYDRAMLETALELKPGALSSQTSLGWSLFLGGLSVMFGVLAIWLTHSARPETPEFMIMPERHSARRGTLEVTLSPRDLKLLRLLDERDGAVVTKDELYDAGWGRVFMPNSRALDQHIINLRRKLDPDKSRPALIETVHGVGYRLLR